MNRIILTPCLAILLSISIIPKSVPAQTGTHIREGGGKVPETVVWFEEPREITEVRLLLQEGKKQLAVDKARNFLDKLRGISGFEAQSRRYFGLSALCSALTMTGELREAIENCSEAVDLYPGRWQAYNNRGVAYYMSGELDLALQDYNQALHDVQGSEPLQDLIQHNIDLVKEKY